MSHIPECKTFQDVWEESRRTAKAVEVKRGVDVDLGTRTLDFSFVVETSVQIELGKGLDEIFIGWLYRVREGKEVQTGFRYALDRVVIWCRKGLDGL